jgi:hypothetical protein
MKDLYGYKLQDVALLCQMVNQEKNKKLTEIFKEFAVKTGKSTGTVRNMYYAMAKLSNENLEFCDKYLNGKPISVYKAKGFSKKEEDELLNKILEGKKKNFSARKVILDISNGDLKLALRLQNKYRNLKKDLREFNEKPIKSIVPEYYYSKLKREIDAMVERIYLKGNKENLELKNRIKALEAENAELAKRVYSSEKTGDEYFRTIVKSRLIN